MAHVDVTDQTFDQEVLSSPLPVLVDFWAEWCGPCRMQNPILEEISHLFEGKVKIAKVNVDDNPSCSSRYAVMSIPTLMLFVGGKSVKQFVGVQTKEKLTAELTAFSQ